MKKILLRGYYGFGNLGDDLMMVTSFGILKKFFPEHSIVISTASGKPGYIPKLLNEPDIEITQEWNAPQADLVFHGGGGTYFDFEKGPLTNRVLNALIDWMGLRNWYRCWRSFQRLRGKSVGPKTRVGMGIGIGSFTASSRKYHYKAAELSSYHQLYVRDRISLEFLKLHGLQEQGFLGSDLVFLREFWLPANVLQGQSGQQERNNLQVGFVLRDWEVPQKDYFDPLVKAMKHLQANGIRVRMYSFGGKADQSCMAHFKNWEQIHWDPASGKLEELLKNLAHEHLLVTSRAHGAIIGAALGIPALCLGIEDKLKQVAGMLPGSSEYLELPLNSSILVNAIENMLGSLKHRSRFVNSDFQANHQVMTQVLEHFQATFVAPCLTRH